MSEGRDRLRNRFFRWIGVVPYDDFDWYADDVLNVLENFERFTKNSAKFATIVAGKLKIKDWNTEIKDLKKKKRKKNKDEEADENNIHRGMFG